MKAKIKVLIADDHSLMRQGLKQILELEEDIEVVGLACDGADAVRQAAKADPDVILMDINMPEMNGIQALRRLKDVGVKSQVIMLTIHDEKSYLQEAFHMGASGYLLKDAEPSNLIASIREIHCGNKRKLYPEWMKDADAVLDESGEKLTRREYEVLTLIAEGSNNKDIAQKLFISEKTVKNHVSSILKKINVNDRTQAAIYAYKNEMKKI